MQVEVLEGFSGVMKASAAVCAAHAGIHACMHTHTHTLTVVRSAVHARAFVVRVWQLPDGGRGLTEFAEDIIVNDNENE